MNADLFFQRYDLLADLPNAVAKMRELVLKLAFQGKLGPQKATDGSANEVLTRIQSERNLEGTRSKKNCALESVNELLSLPIGWVWTTLGRIGDWGSGSTPLRGSIEFYGGPITWLKSGELNDCRSLSSSEERITELAVKKGSFRKNKAGDVLFAMYGATVGKVAILAEPAVTNQAVCGCSPHEGVLNHFLFYYLVSQRQKFRDSSEGGAQPNFSKDKILTFPFPLPPFAEQERIVAKVDELMELCDELETQQQEREKRKVVLARASIARFSESPTTDNVDYLFNNAFDLEPSHVRKAVISIAVRGKLVPQDRKEEICSQAVMKSSQIALRKAKWDGPIGDSEIPFELPQSWTWKRLGDVASLKHGYAFDSKYFRDQASQHVLMTPGNFFESGGFRDRGAKTKYYVGPVKEEFILKANDLLIPMTEQAAGLLGSPAFIPNDGCVYLHNQRLGKFSFSEEVTPEFAFWFFNCEYFRGELARTCTGMKVRHTSPDRVLKVLFPIGPLAEQKRIVAKVEELMTLVDQLEQQLIQSRPLGQQLLDAIVAKLTRN